MLYELIHEDGVAEDGYLIVKVFHMVERKELGQIKLELELGQNHPDGKVKVKVIPTAGVSLRVTDKE